MQQGHTHSHSHGQQHGHVHYHSAPHLSHADPWAHPFICCDADHAASSSSALPSTHASPVILQTAHSGLPPSAFPSAQTSGTTTPVMNNDQPGSCPMEMYCCTDEYCTDHHVECCVDPQCDQPPQVPFADLHGHPPIDAPCHDIDCSVDELAAWACTKEGCHAIQQYLECCTQVDCNLPVQAGESANPVAAHPHSHAHNHHHEIHTPQNTNQFSFDTPWPTNFTPSSTVASPANLIAPPNTAIIPTHICHWQNCHRIFSSMPDLLGHVAADHLGAPGFTSESTPALTMQAPQMQNDLQSPFMPQQPQHQQQQQPQPQMIDPLVNALTGHTNQLGNDPGQELLSCLWDDCLPLSECTAPLPDACPTHSHMPAHPHSAHSHNIATGEPFSPQTMLRHVLEEHLGIPPSIIGWDDNNPNPPLPPAAHENVTKAHDRLHSHHHHHQLPTPSSTAHTPSPPPVKQLICRWPGCSHTEAFSDPGSLMAHLSDEHVGKGKDAYTCQWDNCDRTFRSRQKVLRHLQSHTGHKPFICPVCEQAFGEAAPLAAHMRRHAQEKPFKCEHPGCGKTFAISSSLTIHMRTHNGEKPFVCPYCDKGFVEASNLTKHIRTHTGERPFACSFPGCGKRFPRPDQLKRHMGVHDNGGLKNPRKQRSKTGATATA